MGASIEHQMIELYCFVDECLKTHPRLAPGVARRTLSRSSVMPKC